MFPLTVGIVLALLTLQSWRSKLASLKQVKVPITSTDSPKRRIRRTTEQLDRHLLAVRRYHTGRGL